MNLACVSYKLNSIFPEQMNAAVLDWTYLSTKLGLSDELEKRYEGQLQNSILLKQKIRRKRKEDNLDLIRRPIRVLN